MQDAGADPDLERIGRYRGHIHANFSGHPHITFSNACASLTWSCLREIRIENRQNFSGLYRRKIVWCARHDVWLLEPMPFWPALELLVACALVFSLALTLLFPVKAHTFIINHLIPAIVTVWTNLR